MQAVVKNIDPQGSVQTETDGKITLVLLGNTLHLWPDYELVDIPAAHASDDWWLGADGRVYLRYASRNRAQAFDLK